MTAHQLELTDISRGDTVKALTPSALTSRLTKMRARSIGTRNRRIMRRLKSEATLAELLPALPDDGMAIHTISHGDVDSLSYIAHLVKATPLDAVLVSTWCMAMPDVDEILGWLESGRVGRADFFCGEIFPGSYPDETDKLYRMEAEGRPVTLRIARNHSKVMLASHAETGVFIAIESSANVNTNPRIEQTVMTRDADLWRFYRDFYAGIVSVDRNPYGGAHGTRDAVGVGQAGPSQPCDGA